MTAPGLPARRIDGSRYDPARVSERDADLANWAGGIEGRYASASAAEEAFPGWVGSSADYWSRLGAAGRGLTDGEYSAAYRQARKAGTLPPPRIPAGALRRQPEAAAELEAKAGG
jgi:hypothetical protein